MFLHFCYYLQHKNMNFLNNLLQFLPISLPQISWKKTTRKKVMIWDHVQVLLQNNIYLKIQIQKQCSCKPVTIYHMFKANPMHSTQTTWVACLHYFHNTTLISGTLEVYPPTTYYFPLYVYILIYIVFTGHIILKLHGVRQLDKHRNTFKNSRFTFCKVPLTETP